MDPGVESAIGGISLLGRVRVEAVERLGGLTNRVYRVKTSEADYVLRIPGEGTEGYIDREVEGVNAGVAARSGVSPELLHLDAPRGLMLTRFLEGAVTMSPSLFRERAGAPARAARAFRMIHDWKEPFRTRFELFAKIEEYRTYLAGKGATLPEGYDEAVREAGAVKQILSRSITPLVPCHCDPLAENFLDRDGRMWIVDWEYSGMNDPLWDLADLSVEASFLDHQDIEMLTTYFGHEPETSDLGRFTVLKAMVDLLWTLWGLIQHANQNPAEDFWAYSLNRFGRCRALMGDPSFGRHLAAIR